MGEDKMMQLPGEVQHLISTLRMHCLLSHVLVAQIRFSWKLPIKTAPQMDVVE